MRNNVNIISKKYVEESTIDSSIRTIAKNLTLHFSKIETDHIDLTGANGDALELWISDKKVFEKGISGEVSLLEYGYILTIYFTHEDRTLIPFLKAFLDLYPDMLVCNFETSDLVSIVFNKVQIDAFDTFDPFVTLFTPPN